MISTARTITIQRIDYLLYGIVWQAQKQITQTLTHPAIDLTLPQLMTLFAVQHGGSCRMSTLAERTRQSAGTLTGIVDRLIDDGLLERARSISDRRVIEIVLTEEGARRVNHAVCTHQGEMYHVLAHFSDSDVTIFANLLDQFFEILHQNAPGLEGTESVHSLI